MPMGVFSDQGVELASPPVVSDNTTGSFGKSFKGMPPPMIKIATNFQELKKRDMAKKSKVSLYKAQGYMKEILDNLK